MKLTRTTTVGVIIYLGIYLCGINSKAQTPPLSLKIEIEHSSVKIGADIPVTALLTNNTDQPIPGSKDSSENDHSVQYKVNLEREDHTAVVRKHVEKYRRREPGAEALPGTGDVIFIHIQPGETDKSTVYVNNRYEIDKPGKYLVQLEYDLPEVLGSGVIKSNTITITVTP